MSLCAKNISFSYNGNPVLSDVSLSLAPGGITMLIGANGSGKSTLLKLLSGYLNPDEGNVFFDDVPIEQYNWRERAVRVAFLGQDFFPGLDFSVHETVMMGRNARLNAFSVPGDIDYSIVENALEIFDLKHLESRPVNALSGGERQRTMLAAIFVQQARFMLLDEPTSALDFRHALHLLEHLQEQSANRGILMVTHDLGMALRYASRVMLLNNGRVVAYGPPGEVLTPENLYSAYGCHAEILRGEKSSSVGFFR